MNQRYLNHVWSAVAASSKDLEFIRLDKKLFSKCPSGSIDTMVMERTDNAMMQLLDAGFERYRFLVCSL